MVISRVTIVLVGFDIKINISDAFWTLQASKINNTDVMSQYHLQNKTRPKR